MALAKYWNHSYFGEELSIKGRAAVREVRLDIWQSRTVVIGFNAALLFLVALVDSSTGPEVSLSMFYLIPSVVVAWSVGRTEGLIMAAISSLAWLIVEVNFGREYHHKLVPYCNGFLQLAMALFSALLTAMVREREHAIVQEIAGRKKAEIELHRERLMAEAIEQEQQRLGRDLHDGLGQHLVSTGFVASMLRTKLQEKNLPEANDAEELTALISDAIGQTRLVSRGLCPVKLEAEGLSSALQELTDNVTAQSRVACRFESNSLDINPAPEVSSNLYRIAQEAIGNALKHGLPKNIVVQLYRGQSRLDLSIFNDGKEFSPHPEDLSGMGLRIMDYRARLIGGTCQFGPGPLGGTRVHCTVPVPSSEFVRA